MGVPLISILQLAKEKQIKTSRTLRSATPRQTLQSMIGDKMESICHPHSLRALSHHQVAVT